LLNFKENPKTFLLKSEKQRIIWEEIQNVRPTEYEHYVPGVSHKTISPDDTIRNYVKRK